MVVGEFRNRHSMALRGRVWSESEVELERRVGRRRGAGMGDELVWRDA
jgi:hypothetical protein